MSSENIKKANMYIAELQKKSSEYKKFSKEKVKPFFKKNQKDRKPPGEFVDSSFLYIRAYDGDVGIRPFSGITYWHSPDLAVAPLNDLGAYTNTLDAGKSYQISCNVRNRGDLIVPSANVEFFLVTPSLGFNTQFATKLGVTAGWVNPYSTTKVALNYTIPPDLSGHRCLFARVFSFSPLDLPVDDYQLYPPIDRHVGQLNLNIVQQASSYSFNLVHFDNAVELIQFIPMTMEEVISLRHPFTADFKLNMEKASEFVRKPILKINNNEHTKSNVRLLNRGSRIYFYSRNSKGPSFQEQKAIFSNLMRAVKMKNKVAVNAQEFRKITREYNNMNKQAVNSNFSLQIPNLGLAKGEAAAIKILGFDRATNMIKGGINLIITG